MKSLYIVCKRKQSDRIIIFKKIDDQNDSSFYGQKMWYSRIIWYENYRRHTWRESNPINKSQYEYELVLEDSLNRYDFTFYNDTDKLMVDYFWLFLL